MEMETPLWSSLRGKVALITGAARGIGFEISEYLAGAGATVVATSRGENVEAAEGKIRSKHPQARVVTKRLDVTLPEQWAETAKSVVDELGRIDILVNNAGVFIPRSPVAETTDGNWDYMFRVNLNGVFYGCRAVAPIMIAQEGGTIVNITSYFGEMPQPLFSAYCTSKAAAKALSQSLAMELAHHSITVNAISPGYIESDMVREALVATAEFQGVSTEQAKAKILAGIPAGRFGTGAEIGATVAFLASPGGRYFTAQSLIQGGGVFYH